MDEVKPRKRRLFVGVALDETSRAACAAASQELQKTGFAAKYESAEKLHVTLAFLGFIEPQRVDAIAARLAPCAAKTTPFAVTLECDAHPEFKRVLAEARDEDMVEFISVAGLPARAVATPWLRAYLKSVQRLQANAHERPHCTNDFRCLAQCGLQDGRNTWGQFCIDQHLALALHGDVKRGLFFRGSGKLPFGAEIRSVHALMMKLLGAVSDALEPVERVAATTAA